MPDGAAHTSPRPGLLALADEWRAQLEAMSGAEIDAAQAELAAELEDTPTAARFREARAALRELEREVERVRSRVVRLVRGLDVVERQWRRTRRYEVAGLAELTETLRAACEARPRHGARAWLNEVLKALEAGEPAAAQAIAGAGLAFPEALIPGVEEVRAAVSWLREGDLPLDLLERIASGTLPGWQHTLRDEHESRARRLAAWGYVTIAGDLDRAREHLDTAVTLDAGKAWSWAERAALNLLTGAGDPGSRDAQRVIDLLPDEAVGYQLLGACFELAGDFDQADYLYGEALDRLTPREMVSLGRGATLAQPTGRLLLRAAERLVEQRRPQLALEALEDAPLRGVRGAAVYADADVYRVRSLALEQRGDAPRREIAAAAYEAGQRYIWNQDAARAVAELRRAIDLDVDAPDAGWLLADALMIRVGGAEGYPDPERVQQALEAWEGWTEAVGPPPRTSSWAYVTRAFIADDLTNRDELVPERDASMWEAAGWLERALALDEDDWFRWASAAQYLRNVGLRWLALEAVERAADLNPEAVMVRTERQVALANVGRLEDAAAVGRTLIQGDGASGWVSAVQGWILSRMGRPEEAVGLLRRAVTSSYDPGWYRPLLADCLLRAGDQDGARATYRDLLARQGAAPLAWLAVAATVLGDLETAREWLRRAEADDTAERDDVLTAGSLLAFADGDLARGAELLDAALRATTTAPNLKDAVAAFPARLAAVPGTGEQQRARERRMKEVLARVVPEQRAQLEHAPATADDELAVALAELEADETSAPLAGTVLRAIRCRRLASRGEREAAAAGYAELLGGWFGTEARARLLALLSEMRAERAAVGDVTGVERNEAHLAELGASDVVERTLSLTSALVQAGDVDKAKAQVRVEFDHAETLTQRERLHAAHAELELISGDFASAASAFGEAIEAARRHERPATVAQYDARLALLHAVAGDREETAARLREALAAWGDAGAFDADWALGLELRSLSGYAAFQRLFELARPVLADALDELVQTGAVDPLALGDLRSRAGTERAR